MIPEKFIIDEASGVKVTNPEYEWFWRGYRRAVSEYQDAMLRLNDLARQMDAELEILRNKCKEVKNENR